MPDMPNTSPDGLLDASFERLLRRALPDLPADQVLDLQTPLPAFGLDSLGMVALVAEIEREYGFSFPEKALAATTFATAGTLWLVAGASR
jgi:acyl carrier protein